MSSNEVRSTSIDVSSNYEKFISPSPIEDYQFPPHSTQIGLDSNDQNKSVGMGDDIFSRIEITSDLNYYILFTRTFAKD